MKGKWICTMPEVETPMFSRTVVCQAGDRATIEVCGLGWFTLLVNKRQVSDMRFVPAQTNYGYRDITGFAYHMTDRMQYRAYTLTYDLTPYLTEGENVIDVILGNGWFRQKERVCEGRTQYAPSLVLNYELHLTNADGAEQVFYSDGSETCYVYPILESNLYLGEYWDTRLFDAPLAEVPVRISDFSVSTEPQVCPPDRVIRTIMPRLLKREGKVRYYDAGENISGTVHLSISGTCGEIVRMEFAESMKNGKLRHETMGSDYCCASGRPQVQSDRFVLNGRQQELEPMFVFHGFRYFTISCDTEQIIPTVQVIHTDVSVASSFSCDNELLNWLYEAYVRSQLDNLHGCVPSDCPHRERLGYTGDGQACAEAAMLLLDAHGVYTKWFRDVLDSQDRVTGHVKHTAPFMGGGGGPGGWGCAIALLPDRMCERYGDLDAVRIGYEPILHWIAYLESKCEDHIVVSEEPGGWCLGDWCTPDPVTIPEPFVNTCFYIRTLEIAARFSAILGRTEGDALRERAENCRCALRRHYFDGNDYCGGVQGADAYAVWVRLPGWEGLPARMADHYRTLGRLDTGFLGTDILCQVLFEQGLGDIAISLLSSEDDQIGFSMMKQADATTLYEYLNTDQYSQNHPMFGACVRNLFTGLLGIQNREGTVGYTDLLLKPCLNAGVGHARGSVMIGDEWLTVEFTVKEDYRVIRVSVPNHVTAALLVNGEERQLKSGMEQTVVI